MWIGDFVRGSIVVRVLKQRWPNHPIDVLTTSLCAPLLDYMPGVRKGVIWNQPRGRIAFAEHWALSRRLRSEHYNDVIVMPRTLKSALAPAFARIPTRRGFVGEMRFGLLNDLRRGERMLAGMIDRKVAPALRGGERSPDTFPPPQLEVPPVEIGTWRASNAVGHGTAVAIAPGAVGPSKRWTYYPELARQLAAAGLEVWVVGRPGEHAIAAEIVASGGVFARD